MLLWVMCFIMLVLGKCFCPRKFISIFILLFGFPRQVLEDCFKEVSRKFSSLRWKVVDLTWTVGRKLHRVRTYSSFDVQFLCHDESLYDFRDREAV